MGNYLVTGAAGFIGSAVCRRLVDEGHRVHGVIRPGGSEWRLKAMGLYDEKRFGCSTVSLTLGILAFDGQYDALLHFAGLVGERESQEDPVVFYETNVMGTILMLDFCRRRGIKRFIFASSSAVYGKTQAETKAFIGMPHPGTETFIEAHPCKPTSVYGQTKLTAEEVCQLYATAYGINIWPLRLFYVYGPRASINRLPMRWIDQLSRGATMEIHDSASMLDWTYIDDVVEAVLATVNHLSKRSSATPLNICTGTGTLLGALSEMVQHALELGEVAVEVRFAPMLRAVRTCVGSRHRADVELGWQPQVQLADGLKRTVDWYQNERPKEVPDAGVCVQ